MASSKTEGPAAGGADDGRVAGADGPRQDDDLLDDAELDADAAADLLALDQALTADDQGVDEPGIDEPLSGVLASELPRGHDTGSLGPSDLSDSGSDFAAGRAVGAEELVSDSDSVGTGVRAGVGTHDGEVSDAPFDRVVDAGEAGLGSGLDEAEEALRDHPE